MDKRAEAELYAALERECDTSGLKWRGLRVWPLARLTMSEQLWARANAARLPAAPLPPEPDRRMPPAEAGVRTPAEAAGLPPVDFLFWARAEDHADVGARGRYDRYVDPFLEVIGERRTVLKIEPWVEGDARAPSRHFGSVVVDPFHGLPAMPPSPIEPLLRQAAPIDAALGRLAPGLKVDWQDVAQRADQVLSLQPNLGLLLRALRPKAVFTSCYYAYFGLALMKACHVLGIPSVEIQHGQQGPYEPLHTHWTAMPKEGYELLPSHFWAWGERAREDMERWMPAERTAPRILVGGNLWTALWKEGSAPLPPAAELARLEELARGYRRVVLVTLQPLAEPLPAVLRDAMRSSAGDLLWLLRLHPHQRPQAGEIEERLRAAGLRHWELRDASAAPLYPLLRLAGAHVTGWSSVAHEALAMDVPTIIIDPTGRQLFADYIGKGLFHYAQNAEELVRAAGSAGAPTEEQPYIVADRAVAERCLDIIAGCASEPQFRRGITFCTWRELAGAGATRQRNALRSWQAADPANEIILFGDGGIDVPRDQGGIPLLNEMLRTAQIMARNPYVCYVDAETMLSPDLPAQLQRAASTASDFVMVGQGREVVVKDEIGFEPGWAQRLRGCWPVRTSGKVCPYSFVLFRTHLITEMPPFAMDDRGSNSWLETKLAAARGIPLIDTGSALAYHQNASSLGLYRDICRRALRNLWHICRRALRNLWRWTRPRLGKLARFLGLRRG